jgi:hypothetical protein
MEKKWGVCRAWSKMMVPIRMVVVTAMALTLLRNQGPGMTVGEAEAGDFGFDRRLSSSSAS